MRDQTDHTAQVSARLHDPVCLGDRLVCLGFLLLGSYICYNSIFQLNAFSNLRQGSGTVPLLVGGMMILSSLAVLNRLRQGRLLAEEAELPTVRETGRALTLLALTIATVVLMPFLGTVVTLAAFLFVELRFLERRSLWLSAMSALVLPLFLYLLFGRLLGVPLPAGILF